MYMYMYMCIYVYYMQTVYKTLFEFVRTHQYDEMIMMVNASLEFLSVDSSKAFIGLIDQVS